MDGHQLAAQLERILTHGGEDAPCLFATADIRIETVRVSMRDGIRLATTLYLPPLLSAPVIAMRTPYGRASEKYLKTAMFFACRGYAVVSQDCRGTGDSEPQEWHYYMYEPEDGYDLVEWIRRQNWFDGFLGACGGSYAGQTQWCMATHPSMSTLAPEVSGLGIAVNTARLHMFLNSYARSVGKGQQKLAVPHAELEGLMLEETLAGGYYQEPLYRPFSNALLARYPVLADLTPTRARRWLWEQYCALSCAQRARFVQQAFDVSSVSIVEVESLSAIFGHHISHDSHTLPYADRVEMCRSIQAPALMITGWYDWGLNDALATWEMLKREGRAAVRSHNRLIIAPSAHGAPGYREGAERHPELRRVYRMQNNVGLLLQWYSVIRERATDAWPVVIYYLMGANEWRTAEDWPPPQAQQHVWYLAPGGTLSAQAPPRSAEPDRYTYDPQDPTPTVGGSILSNVYTPGSVDVSEVQKRPDVLVFTSPVLQHDLDVVGPLRLILYASSSAPDTDFVARLSDVFPDERAIQLQNGILRARYRDSTGEPELLQSGRVYRLEIDLWATANRFKAGHRLRLDISSADFPRFDRNTNRAGEPGPVSQAVQTLYHDAERNSHLLFSVIT